jgi:hypothetical protein
MGIGEQAGTSMRMNSTGRRRPTLPLFKLFGPLPAAGHLMVCQEGRYDWLNRDNTIIDITGKRLQQLCLCVIGNHIPVRHDDLLNGPF